MRNKSLLVLVKSYSIYVRTVYIHLTEKWISKDLQFDGIYMLWYLKPLKITRMEGMSTFVTMVEEEVLTYGKTVNMYFF